MSAFTRFWNSNCCLPTSLQHYWGSFEQIQTRGKRLLFGGRVDFQIFAKIFVSVRYWLSNCNYRKSSNIRRPQKIVMPYFSQFLILYRAINARPIFNLLPFLRPLDKGVSFEVQNFCLPFTVCITPQNMVSLKWLKLEKIVALPFEDLRYLKFLKLLRSMFSYQKQWKRCSRKNKDFKNPENNIFDDKIMVP